MDYARDLGRVDVWEESLKRSLERRGRPRRSSVELYRLRPERDLTLGDVLERSASYSELRRKAAQRSTMPRPSVALGGISALALVAGSTLPSLLGGSGARAAGKERVAYAADAHARARAEAAVRGSWGSTLESAGTHAASTSRASLSPSSSPHSSSYAAVAHPAAAAPIATSANPVREAAPETVAQYSGGAAVATAAPATPARNVHLASDVTVEAHSAAAAPSESTAHAVAAPATVVSGTRSVPTGATSNAVSGSKVVSSPSGDVQEVTAAPGTGHGATGGVPERNTTPPTIRTTTPPTVRTTTPTTTAPTATTRPTTTTTAPTTTTTAPTTSTSPTTTGSTTPSPNVQQGVNRMIAAGNQIATRPYVYGGGHGSFNSNGYDCSGSVSYVLHSAGLLNSPEDSTELESYGAPGAGRYVTVYANSGHAWMTIEGRRFDTVALAESGSRWSNSMASTSGYVARHPRNY